MHVFWVSWAGILTLKSFITLSFHHGIHHVKFKYTKKPSCIQFTRHGVLIKPQNINMELVGPFPSLYGTRHTKISLTVLENKDQNQM